MARDRAGRPCTPDRRSRQPRSRATVRRGSPPVRDSTERALPIRRRHHRGASPPCSPSCRPCPATPSGAPGATAGRPDRGQRRVRPLRRRVRRAAAATSPARSTASIGSFRPVVIPDDVRNEPGAEQASTDPGNFLDDGTLVTGYAPDDRRRRRLGPDRPLQGEGGRHPEHHRAATSASAMMTLWWANKLKSKDELHVGQTLRIPPVSGLVVTVKDTDTLDSLAAEYDVKPGNVLELNGLDDPTLVVGQVLVLPGAKGAPIPTPKPTPEPVAAAARRAAAGERRRRRPAERPVDVQRRPLRWPVVGGSNYISQYSHSGHYGAGHRGRLRVAASSRPPAAGSCSPAGSPTAAATRSGSPTAAACTRRTTTCRRCRSGPASTSAGPARRPDRPVRLGDRAAPPLRGLDRLPWDGGYPVNPMRYF